MKIAVVLLNLGGPDQLASVRPFLFNLFNDPHIIPLKGVPFAKIGRFVIATIIATVRYKKAQAIYTLMGGKSPLLENTQKQADALSYVLNQRYEEVKVFTCMRYWHPLTGEVMKQINAYNPDQVVLLPLYPHYSLTTTQSSFTEFMRFFPKKSATKIIKIGCYPTKPPYIDALVSTIAPCIQQACVYGKNQGAHRPMVLFSAHGLPESIVTGGDPYVFHIHETVRHVMDKLTPALGDVFDHQICFQSRVGPVKWVEPYTDVMIKEYSQQGRPLVVVPIAFVSDHSETLVELDIEYKELALENGCPLY